MVHIEVFEGTWEELAAHAEALDVAAGCFTLNSPGVLDWNYAAGSSMMMPTAGGAIPGTDAARATM